MKIIFDGSEKSVLEIIDNLPSSHGKAIMARGNSIQLATDEGAKQVWIGDSVVINGNSVTVVVQRLSEGSKHNGNINRLCR